MQCAGGVRRCSFRLRTAGLWAARAKCGGSWGQHDCEHGLRVCCPKLHFAAVCCCCSVMQPAWYCQLELFEVFALGLGMRVVLGAGLMIRVSMSSLSICCRGGAGLSAVPLPGLQFAFEHCGTMQRTRTRKGLRGCAADKWNCGPRRRRS